MKNSTYYLKVSGTVLMLFQIGAIATATQYDCSACWHNPLEAYGPPTCQRMHYSPGWPECTDLTSEDDPTQFPEECIWPANNGITVNWVLEEGTVYSEDGVEYCDDFQYKDDGDVVTDDCWSNGICASVT